jgi:hypothetical protein
MVALDGGEGKRRQDTNIGTKEGKPKTTNWINTSIRSVNTKKNKK